MIIGMRRDPRLDDGEWVRRRYESDGASAAMIAEEVGCSQNAVRLALRRHGVRPRSAREARLLAQARSLGPELARALENSERLRLLYEERRMAASHIAALLGCSDELVLSALRRHGVPIRPKKETRRAEAGMSPQTSALLEDPNWLRETYVESRRSTNDIARELDCVSSTVRYWLNVHGIPLRTPLAARAVYDRAVSNGYREQQRRRVATIARDTGDVGRAYTAVIRILGQLGRVPYSGRESARLEREAMDGLYRAQDALAQRLLLGSDETPA